MARSISTDAKAGRFTKGANNGTLVCNDCGKRRQVANMAITEGQGKGVCVPCYDRAGDDNSVSDGYLSCPDFQARWGQHSEYCTDADDTIVTPKAKRTTTTKEITVKATAKTTTTTTNDICRHRTDGARDCTNTVRPATATRKASVWCEMHILADRAAKKAATPAAAVEKRQRAIVASMTPAQKRAEAAAEKRGDRNN